MRSDVTVQSRELLSIRWEVRFEGEALGTYYTRQDAARMLSLVRRHGLGREKYRIVRIARWRVHR